MFSATGWALKRLLKFVLKRIAGRYLQCEPDLEQLDVQLSTGTFELRHLLLNCGSVNAQLAIDGWALTAGYIGLVRGSLPLTATISQAAGSTAGSSTDAPANLTLDEVLLTFTATGRPVGISALQETATAQQAAARSSPAQANPQQQQQQQQLGQQLFSEDVGLLGQVGVLDGIRLIAGGLESLLQRLSLAATNITVRLEVPAAAVVVSAAVVSGAEAILHVDCIHYFDATPQQQQQQQQAAVGGTAAAGTAAFTSAAGGGQLGARQPAMAPAAIELIKCVSLTGLTIELLELSDSQEAEQSTLMTLLGGNVNAAGATGQASGTWFDSTNAYLSRSKAAMSCSTALDAMSMSSSAMATSALAASASAAGGAAAAADVPDTGKNDSCYNNFLLAGPGNQHGLDFKVELRLNWPAAAAAAAAGDSTIDVHSGATRPGSSSNSGSNAPRITADVSSGAMSIGLQPWQLPLLQLISSAAAAAAIAAAAPQPSSSPARASEQDQRHVQTPSAHQDWGRRSFAESLFFPDCANFIAGSLQLDSSAFRAQGGLDSSSSSSTMGLNFLGSGIGLGDAGSGLYSSVTNSENINMHGTMYNSASSGYAAMYSVYQDARSVLSNMLSGGSSNVRCNAAAMYSSSSVHHPGSQHGPNQQNGPGWHKQQQQQHMLAAVAWSVRVSVEAIAVYLHYHVPSCTPAASTASAAGQRQQMQPKQQPEASTATPCFVMQCNGLVTSVDLAGRGCYVSVKCYCLEATERIPTAWAAADSQLAGLSATELGNVLRLVPAVQGSTGFSHQAPSWNAPSGVAPTASGSSYMSVWPVLLLGGNPLEPGSALPAVQRPSLVIKASAYYHDANITQLVKAVVDCELLPATVWLTSGLLQRLSSITNLLQWQKEQLQLPQASAGDAGDQYSMPATTVAAVAEGHKQGVDAMIASIIDELHGLSAAPAAAQAAAAAAAKPTGSRGSQQQQQPSSTNAAQQRQQQPFALPLAMQGAELAAAVHMPRVFVVLPTAQSIMSALPSTADLDTTDSETNSTYRLLLLDLHGGSSSGGTSSSTYGNALQPVSVVAGLQAGVQAHSSSSNRYHYRGQQLRQQHHGVIAAAAAAGEPKVLPLLRFTATPASATGAQAGQHQQRRQQQSYAMEGCLTRARLFLVSSVVRKGSGSSNNSSLLAAAAAAAAKAAKAAMSSSKLQQQQQGYSLSRLLRKQQQLQQGGLPGSNGAMGRKWTASCVLDACPSAAPNTLERQHGFTYTTQAQLGKPVNAGTASAAPSIGPDDVPYGSAVYLAVTFDPGAGPVPEAIAQAAAMAARHARDRGADGESEGLVSDEWLGSGFTGSRIAGNDGSNGFGCGQGGNPASAVTGCSSLLGVLGFQRICQQGSGVFVHVRAPALSGFMSRSELTALLKALLSEGRDTAAAAAGSRDAAAAATARQQQQQQRLQVTTLLQCRLHCIVQSGQTSRRCNASSHQQQPQPRHQQQQHGSSRNKTSSSSNISSPAGKVLHLATVELMAEELSYFVVLGLGGKPSATASCTYAQGLQLLTGQPPLSTGQLRSNSQMCALLLPRYSKTLGPPGLEILQVQDGSTDSSNGSSGNMMPKASMAAATVTSILLRGATVSMDPGGLSMDWINQLVCFFQSVPKMTATAEPPDGADISKQQQPWQQQQQQQCNSNHCILAVNLQDFAIRCEPRNDTPVAHNSSRMAAAIMLEGAHWTQNPQPGSPQHLLLHSLGFYAAAAAARTGLTPSGLSGGLMQGYHFGGMMGAPGNSSSSNLSCWDPAAPVDLHGFSLSAAGYHCLAQEGGLSVVIKPAAAAAAAAFAGGSSTAGTAGATANDPASPASSAGDDTLEVEVTNRHLTGSLRKDTAALALQLINQWAAHALLRNPPRGPAATTSSSTTASSNAGSTAGSGVSKVAATPVLAAACASDITGPGQNAVVSQVLAALEHNTFTVSKKPAAVSGSTSQVNPVAAEAGSGIAVRQLPPGKQAAAGATAKAIAAASAGIVAAGNVGNGQQVLESSMFLSGGWYHDPEFQAQQGKQADSGRMQGLQQHQQHKQYEQPQRRLSVWQDTARNANGSSLQEGLAAAAKPVAASNAGQCSASAALQQGSSSDVNGMEPGLQQQTQAWQLDDNQQQSSSKVGSSSNNSSNEAGGSSNGPGSGSGSTGSRTRSSGDSIHTSGSSSSGSSTAATGNQQLPSTAVQQSPVGDNMTSSNAVVASTAMEPASIDGSSDQIAAPADTGHLLASPLSEGLLAASILCTLPPEDLSALNPAPVVLDDFFPRVESPIMEEQGPELEWLGIDVMADCYDAGDDDYDMVSPRAAAAAAAEARAARARALTAAAAGGGGVSMSGGFALRGSGEAAPPEADGIWYPEAISSPRAVTAAAPLAAGTAAGLPGTRAATSNNAVSTMQHSASGSSNSSSNNNQHGAHSAAHKGQQHVPIAASAGLRRAQESAGSLTVHEDYLQPVQLQQHAQQGSAAAATAGLSDAVPHSNADSAVRLTPGALAAHTGAGLHGRRDFVSPWFRVLSHPIFRHLLPRDPHAPKPVTRLMCKGLSAMFVLHDRGAPMVPPAACGGSSSSGRGMAAAGCSGGRLEVEVEGMALLMEIYPPGHCHVSRMTVALGSIEIRDCQGAAAAAAAAAGSGASSSGSGAGASAGVAAAAQKAAAAATAAAAAAAAAAKAGHGPRRVAAAAAGAVSSSGRVPANAGSGSSGGSSGLNPLARGSSSSKSWSRVLSVRRPGTRGGAAIRRELSKPAAAGSASKQAAVSPRQQTDSSGSGSSSIGSKEQPQQREQFPLLGGMLQGWPAAVLAPDSLLPAAAVVLETVRPDPLAAPDTEEYRLAVAMLPVRLRLNQDLVAFLVGFSKSVSEAVAAVENPLTSAIAAVAAAGGGHDAAAAAAAQAHSQSGAMQSGGQQQQGQSEVQQVADLAACEAAVGVQPPFFQKAVMWGSGVCIEYSPRRVDIAALRDGEFLELLNLVPWGGVDLTLKPLRFTGLVGWDGLAAAAAAEWISYVAQTQAHKFLTGVAPIRSVVRVGGAVAALLAGPAASLQQTLGDAVGSASRGIVILASKQGSGNAAVRLQQQLNQTVAAAKRAAAVAMAKQDSSGSSRRVNTAGSSGFASTVRHSSAGFARVLLYEAVGVGASVAAGAQAVLAGGTQQRLVAPESSACDEVKMV